MRAQHDALATAETCAGCKIDPGGFDHEAVRRMRPKDFDHQVETIMLEGIKTGKIAGVTLSPYSRDQAARYLASRCPK